MPGRQEIVTSSCRQDLPSMSFDGLGARMPDVSVPARAYHPRTRYNRNTDLRRAIQRHDWKMTSAVVEVDVERESIT